MNTQSYKSFLVKFKIFYIYILISLFIFKLKCVRFEENNLYSSFGLFKIFFYFIIIFKMVESFFFFSQNNIN